MIIELEQAVQLAPLIEQQPLVLVDFWAVWCAPCRAMLPSLEALAQNPKLTLVKVNADNFPELLAMQGVRGLPFIQLYKNGLLVEQTTQTLTLSGFKRWLAPYLRDHGEELLAQALSLEGEAKLHALSQVLAIAPNHQAAQEAYCLTLKTLARVSELAAHLHQLSPELKRSPELARLEAWLELKQQQSFPEPLAAAMHLAQQENYPQALEALLALLAEPELGQLASDAIVRLLNIMPERALAQQYRRQLVAATHHR